MIPSMLPTHTDWARWRGEQAAIRTREKRARDLEERGRPDPKRSARQVRAKRARKITKRSSK